MKDSEIYTKRKRNVNNLLKNIKQIWKVDFGGQYEADQEQVLEYDSELLKKFIEGTLVDAILPEGLTKISEYRFSFCDNLESITLPSSLRYIHDNAFEGCDKLESITLPKNVTVIGKEAFKDCTSLTTITCLGGPAEMDAYAIPFNTGLKIYVPSEFLTEYISASQWSNYEDYFEAIPE